MIRANYTCYFISSKVKISREYTHIDFSVFILLRFPLILLGPLDSEPQGTDISVTFSKCCSFDFISPHLVAISR